MASSPVQTAQRASDAPMWQRFQLLVNLATIQQMEMEVVQFVQQENLVLTLM
jgi:hypothetical protein